MRTGSEVERRRALEAENKRLKQRRTKNQRRQSDANLADRRTKVAQGQADAAQAALQEYGVSAEVERAATERADQLEKQARAILHHPAPTHAEDQLER
jgi:hypothetical protein